MDLLRFISMLFTRQLRFTKAATYKDDPWEGFCEVRHLEFPPELTKESPGHAVHALASNYSRKEYESAPRRGLSSSRLTSRAMRRGGSSPASASNLDTTPGITTPEPRNIPR